MRKYFVVFRVALADRLVYRADFFIATFLRFIPIITTILLWRAIYDGSQKVELGNLMYEQMVAYYLFLMISRAFGSMPRLATDIATDIRDGNLRKYLLQPIDYLGYNVSLRVAHKLVYFVMAATPYALVFWLCRRYLPGWPTGSMLLLSVFSLGLSFLIGFMFNSLMGLLGFWFLEVGSFIHVVMVMQYFLSGHMFPLSLLPAGLQSVVTNLPFAYETYYPTLLLLQRLDTGAAMHVISMQMVWVVVLGSAARIAWLRGLKRYAAFGG